MIVNALAILALFVAAVELIGGGALVTAAVRGWRRLGGHALSEHGRRRRSTASDRTASDRTASNRPASNRPASDRPGATESAESLRHLLFLLVAVLAGLSLVSVVLWGLLLESYVPQWEGVRCVVGVLKVGTGSQGAAGWLPALADVTAVLRVALLLGAGAAVAVHLASRDQPAGALTRRQLALALMVGLVAIGAAATETAYIVIPKAERFLAAGCCSTAGITSSSAGLLLGRAAWTGTASTGTAATFFGAPALVLSVVLFRGQQLPAAGTWTHRAVTDVVRVAVAGAVLIGGLLFVNDLVAPAALGLPLHQCTYCLAAAAPETLVGLALLATPLLAVSWGAAARWLGPGEGPTVDALRRSLDRIAAFSTLAAVGFFAVAWGVA